MRARTFLVAVATCMVMAALAGCASSEPELRGSAADASRVGPAPSGGSGVLREGFDPSSLAPPAPDGGGHEHHQHHGMGHEDPPAQPAPSQPKNTGSADPHAGHGAPPAGAADPHAAHRNAAPSASSAMPRTPPAPSAATPSRPVPSSTPPAPAAPPPSPAPSAAPPAMPPGHHHAAPTEPGIPL